MYIVTANKHIGICILSITCLGLVRYGSTVRLKLNLQHNNRLMMKYSVTKISQKGIFFFYMRLYYITFAVNLIKPTQRVSLQRDNYNVELCLISSEISILFSSATTVTTINLI